MEEKIKNSIKELNKQKLIEYFEAWINYWREYPELIEISKLIAGTVNQIEYPVVEILTWNYHSITVKLINEGKIDKKIEVGEIDKKVYEEALQRLRQRYIEVRLAKVEEELEKIRRELEG